MNLTILVWMAAVWILSVPAAFGIASTAQVAWPRQPVIVQAGWPTGALEVINDPARTTGWNPWFSELPNDVNYFGYEAGGPDDLQRLINKVGSIAGAVIVFSPKTNAVWIGYGGVSRWSTNTVAVFALGNQARLNAWHARQVPPVAGTSTWVLGDFRKAPRALSPTLTVYAGHESVRWKHLRIPNHVQVALDTAGIDEGERQLGNQIESFLRNRR